jgi:hypothetical protein
MPKTKSYFESVKETVEDFHLRRIEWAIREIERDGLDLQWWRIVRKAGIRGETAEELRSYFDAIYPGTT